MSTSRFGSPELAWVRPVSESFRDALRMDPVPLDPERARRQHDGYCAALRDAGVDVRTFPGAPECPDAVFVEDLALVLDAGRVWMTIPGAPSRRPEGEGIRRAFVADRYAVADQDRGTLDGGDVLRVGRRWFVGVSARTDADGVRALARVVDGPVIPVPVGAGLHLKSSATLVSPGVVLVDPAGVSVAPFHDLGIEVLETDEPFGANVLALADRVLVSAAAPRTARRLADRGHRVVTVDVSELHRADGALTCLSLRVPAPGCWCA